MTRHFDRRNFLAAGAALAGGALLPRVAGAQGEKLRYLIPDRYEQLVR